MRSLGVPLAVLLLSACAAVPKLGPAPQQLAPADVAANRSLPGVAGAQWPSDGWWNAYGDAQLDGLIAEGLRNSPDVASAAARFARAAAMSQQAGAALLPKVDLQGSVAEQKQSLNMGYPPEFQAFLPHGWNDTGQVAANIGFDLDLWGKNRAALAAATSDQRAAAIDVEQARLALSTGIALAYFDLARLQAERDLRAEQLNIAVSSQKLLAQRQANGLETRGGVATSEAELATARATLNQADEALDLRRHQIAALVGAGPDRGLAITRPTLAPVAPRGLPEGVTTDLLGRRPDISAARERTEAAASRIKVARADFFPSIRLTALIGFQSLGLGQLFATNSQFGSVGPAISLPLFHGGELQGKYRGARADYDASVAAYNSAVLTAYQQAADAVTTARAVSQRLADARAALAASQEAYGVITARYKAGLVTYLEVLQVQDRLLNARLSVAALEAAVRNSDIALVRALGGGFVAPAVTTSRDQNHG